MDDKIWLAFTKKKREAYGDGKPNPEKILKTHALDIRASGCPVLKYS